MLTPIVLICELSTFYLTNMGRQKNLEEQEICPNSLRGCLSLSIAPNPTSNVLFHLFLPWIIKAHIHYFCFHLFIQRNQFMSMKKISGYSGQECSKIRCLQHGKVTETLFQNLKSKRERHAAQCQNVCLAYNPKY